MVYSKINETGNLRLLGNFKDLKGHWEFINDEIISKFGIDEDYKNYLNSCKRWMQAEIDNIESPSTLTAAMVALRSAELEAYLNKEQVGTIEKNLAEMEKIKGFKLDFKHLSTLEYFTYINDLKNGRKKN